MKIKVKATYISIGLLVCFAVVSYGMNSDDKLVEAIKCRNIPVALNILNQNVCIDIQDEQGNTLLHLASLIDSPELIQALLDKGADVNSKTSTDLTPLHRAAMRGSLKALILLLDNGAQVNVQSNKGNTPLHTAALFGQIDAARILLNYGADKTILNIIDKIPFDMVGSIGILPENADKQILLQLLMQ